VVAVAVQNSVEVKPRILVTRAMCGICHMQVCVVKDATDEEILEVCNRENPAGTSLGWGTVCRGDEHAPVICDDDPERLHLMVSC
jgi:hypothetical protein